MLGFIWERDDMRRIFHGNINIKFKMINLKVEQYHLIICKNQNDYLIVFIMTMCLDFGDTFFSLEKKICNHTTERKCIIYFKFISFYFICHCQIRIQFHLKPWLKFSTWRATISSNVAGFTFHIVLIIIKSSSSYVIKMIFIYISYN